MKPWEKYGAAAAEPAPAEAGPWSKYQAPEEPAQPTEQTLALRKIVADKEAGTFRQNLAAGLVRGAGSIGATLMAPIDVASDAIEGRGLTLESNRQRRQDMDATLRDWGANPDSLAFKGGKLSGEIAGTAGVGGAIANTAGRIPQVASAAPNLLNSIRTGGFTAGQAAPGVGGTLANLATRATGGAITGGASAGLVNPEDAKTGALIGGELPVATQAAGVVGRKIGSIIRGPEQSADLAAAVAAARDAGYVIPPTQARPTLLNRLAEGFSGKITTAQNASARNQGLTNSLAARELGLPADTKLTTDVLNNLRRQAGQAYDAVASTGTIIPGPAYQAALDKITAPAKLAAAGFPNAKTNPLIAEIESLKSPQFDAASAVEKIKDLRSQADSAYAAGNKALGKAYKDAARVMEDAIDSHLSSLGVPPEMLEGFRDARALIAKTYSVENALNATSGSVDARKLAAQAAKGKPISGDLRTIADFAARFPKAAQTVEGMGSLPQTSPLDWAAGGGISAATGNPLMLAGVMARPAARKLTLSDLVQNRLIQPQSAPSSAAANDLAQFAYRTVPVIAASR